MKILQFLKENEVRLGVLTERGVLDVKASAKKFELDMPVQLDDLITHEEGLSLLANLVQKVIEEGRSELFLPEEDLDYASAVTNPEKILCIGLNYSDHAKETNMAIPSSPILFSKFNNALTAHLEPITIPQGTEQMDYEAELVIVIGKTAKNVSEAEALSYVFGYTVGNDLSARDLQMRSGQWLLGKTSDGFAPVGPYIVTGEGIDPNNLSIECTVNGVTVQKGNTSNMIFNCATVISYASHYMTLKPGDLIFTGTPAGVIMGYPKEQQVWLKPGDEMVVSIENIGALKNVLQ